MKSLKKLANILKQIKCNFTSINSGQVEQLMQLFDLGDMTDLSMKKLSLLRGEMILNTDFQP